MNQYELQAQYDSVQRNIRAQFEEIEAITNQEGDNKDLIIEKLAIQNQYIYSQYTKLYEKSLTIDDIAHLVDISSMGELEIKQYVQEQVKQAFEEKKTLEMQLGSLNIEMYKLKEKLQIQEQINDRNIYKKQFDDLMQGYSDYRNHSLNQFLNSREINMMNFKNILMKDLEIIVNMIDDQKANQFVPFSALKQEREQQNNFQKSQSQGHISPLYNQGNSLLSQNDAYQKQDQSPIVKKLSKQNSAIQLQQNISVMQKYQQTQKLNRSESVKSQDRTIKEPYSKKSSSVFNDNPNEKSINISALLRANKIEIENELRTKLQSIHSPQKDNQILIGDDDDEFENDKYILCNEKLKKEEGIKTIVKHSIQRLNALIDEISSQSTSNQPIIDSLRDEIIDLTSRVYTMRHFSQDEESEKWNKIVKNVTISNEERINTLAEENSHKERDIQKLREFIQGYEQQIENMKKFIEDIEKDSKDKQDLVSEMNSKVQSMQLQIDDEQNFYQTQMEEKNNQVIKLTTQLQQISIQKNELLIQNSTFKEEIAKIEDQLSQMIRSKREHDEGLDQEKEDTYLQFNKLRTEFELEIQKYSIQIQEYESQIELLRKQIQLKDIEMDEMQQTFNELESFSKRQLNVIQNQQEQIIKCKKAKEKNREYKQMIQSSSNDIQTLKNDFNKLIAQTQAIQKELDMRNNEKSKHKEETSLLKKRNEGFEKRIEALQKRNDELENIVAQKDKTLEQQVKYVNCDSQYFEKKIGLLEQENIQLIQENSTLLEQKKELTNKSNVLISSVEQLQDQNEKSVDLNTQLASERDSLQEKLFKLTDLIALNREKLQKQEQDIQQYQQLIDSFRSSQKQNTFNNTDHELSTNSIFNQQYLINSQMNQQSLINSQNYMTQQSLRNSLMNKNQMNQQNQHNQQQNYMNQQSSSNSQSQINSQNQLDQFKQYQMNQPIQYNSQNQHNKQNQFNIQRSISLQKDGKGDIIVQQEYQPNQIVSIPQHLQFTNSNSNSKYQRVSTFSQPFYGESENYVQNSNYSNHNMSQQDRNSKYSFSDPNQNNQMTFFQPIKTEEEPASTLQSKRGIQDDNPYQNANLTYSKSNLSYSPFTVQNEALNSDDTFNTSNINQNKYPADNQYSYNQLQYRTDRYNQQQNQPNFQQQQFQQIPQNNSYSFKQQQDYSTINNYPENNKPPSRHKLSLDEDLKRLNSLALAMGDRKQLSQQK